jgi:hypothetical protein
VRADTVLCVAEKPHGGKPLRKRDRRILKDGADFYRELLVAFGVLAFPNAATG